MKPKAGASIPPTNVTRIAVMADVHIGNHAVMGGPMTGGINERCLATLRSFEAALAAARMLGAAETLILGDLFDTDKPPPMMVHAVMAILDAHDDPVTIIPGNHDVHSDWAHDSAVAPLSFLSHVTVYNSTTEHILDNEHRSNLRALLAPHQSGRRGVNVLESAVELARESPVEVLGFHAGVKDQHTPPWLAHSEGAVHVDDVHAMMVEAGALRAVCGDWHDRRVWSFEDGCEIVQVGSLCPTGFDDTSPKHGITVLRYDEDAEEWLNSEFHPIAGPRFYKIEWSASLTTPTLYRILYDHTATRAPAYVWITYATPEEAKDAERAWNTVTEGTKNNAQMRAKFTPATGATRAEDSAVVLPTPVPVPDMIQNYVSAMPATAFEHGTNARRVVARALELYERAKKG